MRFEPCTTNYIIDILHISYHTMLSYNLISFISYPSYHILHIISPIYNIHIRPCCLQLPEDALRSMQQAEEQARQQREQWESSAGKRRASRKTWRNLVQGEVPSMRWVI